MPQKEKRPVLLRLFNSLCAFSIIGAAIYLLFVGLETVPVLLLLVACAGIATPASIGSDGLLDAIGSIFEALLEGIMGIIETIGDIFSGV